MIEFVAMWFDIASDYPITLFVFTISFLLLLLHIIVPMVNGLQGVILDFWSRGEEKVKPWYNKFVAKLPGVNLLNLVSDFEIVKLSQVRSYDIMSNVVSELKGVDGDHVVIKTKRYSDYVSKNRQYVTPSCGTGYVSMECVFANEEEAQDFLIARVPFWGHIAIILVGILLLGSLVSLLLDVLLTKFFLGTLVVASIIALVSMFMYGGRAMYDVKRKFKAIDKVLENEKS